MRNSSPKQLAFFIASLASIISTASVFTIQVYTSTYFIVILLPSMVLSFGIVYFVALYIIKYLILEKIDPIYKTIRNVTLDEKAIKRDLDDKDMIRAVEKDVIIWAKTKKKRNC